jgi:ATP phosphoribosyltransferase
MKKILFAVPKGRILKELQSLLEAASIIPEDDFFNENSRKIIFKTNFDNLEIIKVRSFDVATFIRFGACDIGVCGRDVVEEFASNEIYEVKDLKIGKCRLSLALENSQKNVDLSKLSHVRVASKYVNLTSKFFAKNGIQAEVIKLNGAMEIAPKLGLSQFIVDLVDSGKTLQENDMFEFKKIMDVSSYLVVNRTSFKTKNKEINALLKLFNV